MYPQPLTGEGEEAVSAARVTTSIA
jgi:hypothetical protein